MGEPSKHATDDGKYCVTSNDSLRYREVTHPELSSHVGSIFGGPSTTRTHVNEDMIANAHSLNVSSSAGGGIDAGAATPSTSVAGSGWVIVGPSATGGTSVVIRVGKADASCSAGVGVVVHGSKDDHGVRARPLKALLDTDGSSANVSHGHT